MELLLWFRSPQGRKNWLEHSGHNLEPFVPKVFKLGLFLIQQKPPNKENFAIEPFFLPCSELVF